MNVPVMRVTFNSIFGTQLRWGPVLFHNFEQKIEGKCFKAYATQFTIQKRLGNVVEQLGRGVKYLLQPVSHLVSALGALA